MNKVKFSRLSIFASIVVIVISGTIFYPKWQKSGSETTLSWDVSGYYLYLPAAFIYKDLKGLKFMDTILPKYAPTPNFQQAYIHEEGSYVMKYSMGQAVQMFPFFIIGHWIALTSDNYLADGFSRPYQFMIYLGGLLYAILCLLLWRRILIRYFDEWVTGVTILIFVLGTNYLEYAGITNAMTHNNLAMWYAILLLLSIRFHESASYNSAIAIGCTVGIMALTRPTELIAILIPILWGMKQFNLASIKKRTDWLTSQRNYLLITALVIVFVGSWQLIYWKYATGDWVVYSYEDQGFSWLKPHLLDGLFSYKAGWLIYSPICLFIFPGFYFLYRKKKHLFWPCFLYFLLFTYVAFAWDIWWYGGSLGQRTMVQIYPLLSLPMAAFVMHSFKNTNSLLISGLLSVIFIYFNGWLIYQAHGGGLLRVEQMTKAYFWEVVGRWEVDKEKLKLLDNKDWFEGIPRNKLPLSINESSLRKCDSEWIKELPYCISSDQEFTTIFNNNLPSRTHRWVRVIGHYRSFQKEYNVWKMPQVIIKFYNSGEFIRQRSIKLHRILDPNQTKEIYMDAKIPAESDRIEVLFWNGSSSTTTLFGEMDIFLFN